MRKLHLATLFILLFLLSSCQIGRDFNNVNMEYVGSYNNEDYYSFYKYSENGRSNVIRKTSDGTFTDVYVLDENRLVVQYKEYLLLYDETHSNTRKDLFELYNLDTETTTNIQLYVEYQITKLVYMDNENILFSNRGYNNDSIDFYIYNIQEDSVQKLSIFKVGGSSNVIAFVDGDTLFVNLYYHKEEDKYFYAYDLPTGAETLTIFEKNQYMIQFRNSTYFYLFPTQTGNNFTILELNNRWEKTDVLKHLNYSYVYFIEDQLYEKEWYTNKINVIGLDLVVQKSIDVPDHCHDYDIVDSTKYTCIVERNRGSIIKNTDYKVYTYSMENEIIYESDWLGSGNQLEYWN